MPDRQHYPDLNVEYECRDDLYVARADWREGRWVCENDQWAIRLTPTGDGVTCDSFLFNRQSRRRYQCAKQALIIEARKYVNQERYA